MNNPKPLENEDLRVFATVVRKGGFGAAAAELGMSPAYVSKRIGILDDTLGVALFARSTRRVLLTEDGERVLARELAGHDCLAIKERDHPIGVWRLRGRNGEETVKVSGPLSTNHGEIALRWAVEGAGIVLRSAWDAQPLIDAGRLVQVLPEYTQEAKVWAVYPQRLAGSARLRACVDFLRRELEAYTVPPGAGA